MSAPNASELAVLLVEDNPADARLVREMLRDAGPKRIAVTHAPRLHEAVQHLRTQGFSAILLDLTLPDSEGLQTFTRARTEAPAAPIVVLTGISDEELAARAVREGAQDYLVKGQVDGPLLYRSIRYAVERHAVEEQLRTSEARYRTLVESSIQGLCIQVDGVVRLANRALADLLGFTRPDDLVGTPIWSFIAREDRAAFERQTQTRLAGECTRDHFEFRAITRDGTVISLACLATALPWEDEQGMLITVVDITEWKRAEAELKTTQEQLAQAQKMEAIGKLAGGVAHDFNNLLTAILGYTELVLQDLGPGHPSAADLDVIQNAAHSAEHLTRQLLAFSRRQILQPQSLDLNEILRRIEALLRRVIGEDVSLRLALAPDLARVHADPGQIEQVVMNLAVNARDAMPEGGELLMESANVELDALYTGRHGGSAVGPHVMIAVSDTGHGIDEETKARLFEPFFTTKPRGKGTGLGLATVYGIVKQSGGSIWVYSEVGKGTTFKVYLPVSTDAPVERVRATVEPVSLDGTETILVVEDQHIARSVVQEVLRRHGYQVLEATDAVEALSTAAAHQGPIHLLLTDVVLPQGSGRRAADALRAARSGLRVIYMSGYTDDAIVHRGILEAGLEFLQKPFTGERLLRKVRAVLDAPEPPPI